MFVPKVSQSRQRYVILNASSAPPRHIISLSKQANNKSLILILILKKQPWVELKALPMFLRPEGEGRAQTHLVAHEFPASRLIRDEMRPVRKRHMFLHTASSRLNYLRSAMGKYWDSGRGQRGTCFHCPRTHRYIGFYLFRRIDYQFWISTSPAEQRWKACGSFFSWFVPSSLVELMDSKVSCEQYFQQ